MTLKSVLNYLDTHPEVDCENFELVTRELVDDTFSLANTIPLTCCFIDTDDKQLILFSHIEK